MASNATDATKEVLWCWDQMGPNWNKRSDFENGQKSNWPQKDRVSELINLQYKFFWKSSLKMAPYWNGRFSNRSVPNWVLVSQNEHYLLHYLRNQQGNWPFIPNSTLGTTDATDDKPEEFTRYDIEKYARNHTGSKYIQ